jgi:DNA replication protein DnaC
MARGDGTIKKIFKQYQKVNLLILDEWMLVSLKESEARDLLEIIHIRHKGIDHFLFPISHRQAGTRKSGKRHWPTPFSTGLSTIRTR